MPKLKRTQTFSSTEVFFLLGLMGPLFMALLTSGMLGVALPEIQNEYRMSVDLLAWVVAAALVTKVALTPVFGKLGDIYDKKALFLTGLGFFALGSALSYLAPSLIWLLCGRVLQGIGDASFPLAMALIADSFAPERRGRALGVWSAASPLGIIIGPILGGLVVDYLGWRGVFGFISVGSLISLMVGHRLIPDQIKRHRRRLGSMDWIGMTSLVLSVSGLLLAMTSAKFAPYGSSTNMMMWAISGVGIVVLIWNSRHNPSPLISSKIMKNKRFIIPSLAASARMFISSGVRFLIVLYLADVFGLSSRTIGMILVVYTAPLLVGIMTGGHLADRLSTRLVASTSLLLQAVGLGWLGLIGSQSGIWGLVPGMMLTAMGAGSCLVPLTKEAIGSLESEKAGLSSGLYNTIRFAGLAVAAPILGLVMERGIESAGGDIRLDDPYLLGFQLLTLVALIGALGAMAIPIQKVREQDWAKDTTADG